MPQPDDLAPPTDRDPREDRLARRSRAPAVTIGVVLGLVIILAGLTYVIAAVSP